MKSYRKDQRKKYRVFTHSNHKYKKKKRRRNQSRKGKYMFRKNKIDWNKPRLHNLYLIRLNNNIDGEEYLEDRNITHETNTIDEIITKVNLDNAMKLHSFETNNSCASTSASITENEKQPIRKLSLNKLYKLFPDEKESNFMKSEYLKEIERREPIQLFNFFTFMRTKLKRKRRESREGDMPVGPDENHMEQWPPQDGKSHETGHRMQKPKGILIKKETLLKKEISEKEPRTSRFRFPLMKSNAQEASFHKRNKADMIKAKNIKHNNASKFPPDKTYYAKPTGKYAHGPFSNSNIPNVQYGMQHMGVFPKMNSNRENTFGNPNYLNENNEHMYYNHPNLTAYNKSMAYNKLMAYNNLMAYNGPMAYNTPMAYNARIESNRSIEPNRSIDPTENKNESENDELFEEDTPRTANIKKTLLPSLEDEKEKEKEKEDILSIVPMEKKESKISKRVSYDLDETKQKSPSPPKKQMGKAIGSAAYGKKSEELSQIETYKGQIKKVLPYKMNNQKYPLPMMKAMVPPKKQMANQINRFQNNEQNNVMCTSVPIHESDNLNVKEMPGYRNKNPMRREDVPVATEDFTLNYILQKYDDDDRFFYNPEKGLIPNESNELKKYTDGMNRLVEMYFYDDMNQEVAAEILYDSSSTDFKVLDTSQNVYTTKEKKKIHECNHDPEIIESLEKKISELQKNLEELSKHKNETSFNEMEENVNTVTKEERQTVIEALKKEIENLRKEKKKKKKKKEKRKKVKREEEEVHEIVEGVEKGGEHNNQNANDPYYFETIFNEQNLNHLKNVKDNILENVYYYVYESYDERDYEILQSLTKKHEVKGRKVHYKMEYPQNKFNHKRTSSLWFINPAYENYLLDRKNRQIGDTENKDAFLSMDEIGVEGKEEGFSEIRDSEFSYESFISEKKKKLEAKKLEFMKFKDKVIQKKENRKTKKEEGVSIVNKTEPTIQKTQGDLQIQPNDISNIFQNVIENVSNSVNSNLINVEHLMGITNEEKNLLPSQENKKKTEPQTSPDTHDMVSNLLGFFNDYVNEPMTQNVLLPLMDQKEEKKQSKEEEEIWKKQKEQELLQLEIENMKKKKELEQMQLEQLDLQKRKLEASQLLEKPCNEQSEIIEDKKPIHTTEEVEEAEKVEKVIEDSPMGFIGNLMRVGEESFVPKLNKEVSQEGKKQGKVKPLLETKETNDYFKDYLNKKNNRELKKSDWALFGRPKIRKEDRKLKLKKKVSYQSENELEYYTNMAERFFEAVTGYRSEPDPTTDYSEELKEEESEEILNPISYINPFRLDMFEEIPQVNEKVKKNVNESGDFFRLGRPRYEKKMVRKQSKYYKSISIQSHGSTVGKKKRTIKRTKSILKMKSKKKIPFINKNIPNSKVIEKWKNNLSHIVPGQSIKNEEIKEEEDSINNNKSTKKEKKLEEGYINDNRSTKKEKKLKEEEYMDDNKSTKKEKKLKEEEYISDNQSTEKEKKLKEEEYINDNQSTKKEKKLQESNNDRKKTSSEETDNEFLLDLKNKRRLIYEHLNSEDYEIKEEIKNVDEDFMNKMQELERKEMEIKKQNEEIQKKIEKEDELEKRKKEEKIRKKREEEEVKRMKQELEEIERLKKMEERKHEEEELRKQEKKRISKEKLERERELKEREEEIKRMEDDLQRDIEEETKKQEEATKKKEEEMKKEEERNYLELKTEENIRKREEEIRRKGEELKEKQKLKRQEEVRTKKRIKERHSESIETKSTNTLINEKNQIATTEKENESTFMDLLKQYYNHIPLPQIIPKKKQNKEKEEEEDTKNEFPEEKTKEKKSSNKISSSTKRINHEYSTFIDKKNIISKNASYKMKPIGNNSYYNDKGIRNSSKDEPKCIEMKSEVIEEEDPINNETNKNSCKTLRNIKVNNFDIFNKKEKERKNVFREKYSKKRDEAFRKLTNIMVSKKRNIKPLENSAFIRNRVSVKPWKLKKKENKLEGGENISQIKEFEMHENIRGEHTQPFEEQEGNEKKRKENSAIFDVGKRNKNEENQAFLEKEEEKQNIEQLREEKKKMLLKMRNERMKYKNVKENDMKELFENNMILKMIHSNNGSSEEIESNIGTSSNDLFEMNHRNSFLLIDEESVNDLRNDLMKTYIYKEANVTLSSKKRKEKKYVRKFNEKYKDMYFSDYSNNSNYLERLNDSTKKGKQVELSYISQMEKNPLYDLLVETDRLEPTEEIPTIHKNIIEDEDEDDEIIKMVDKFDYRISYPKNKKNAYFDFERTKNSFDENSDEEIFNEKLKQDLKEIKSTLKKSIDLTKKNNVHPDVSFGYLRIDSNTISEDPYLNFSFEKIKKESYGNLEKREDRKGYRYNEEKNKKSSSSGGGGVYQKEEDEIFNELMDNICGLNKKIKNIESTYKITKEDDISMNGFSDNSVDVPIGSRVKYQLDSPINSHMNEVFTLDSCKGRNDYNALSNKLKNILESNKIRSNEEFRLSYSSHDSGKFNYNLRNSTDTSLSKEDSKISKELSSLLNKGNTHIYNNSSSVDENIDVLKMRLHKL